MKMVKPQGFKNRVRSAKDPIITSFKNLYNLNQMLSYETTLEYIKRSTPITEVEIGQEGKYINGDFYKSLILSIPGMYYRYNKPNTIKDITNNPHIFDSGNNIC